MCRDSSRVKGISSRDIGGEGGVSGGTVKERKHDGGNKREGETKNGPEGGS